MEHVEALLGYCDRVRQRLQGFDFAEKRLAFEALHIQVRWTPGHSFQIDGSIPLGEIAPIPVSSEHGFALFLAVGTILHGWALTEDEGERISLIQRGLSAYQATGAELGQPWVLALLAEAYGQAGRAKEGLCVLTEALARADKSGERCYEAELYRLQGELLRQHAEGRKEQADVAPKVEACFRQALEGARGQQAKSLELRAAMSLSRLWQHQDKPQEAHQLLAEIYDWFTEGFDTADLQEAKALLDELS